MAQLGHATEQGAGCSCRSAAERTPIPRQARQRPRAVQGTAFHDSAQTIDRRPILTTVLLLDQQRLFADLRLVRTPQELGHKPWIIAPLVTAGASPCSSTCSGFPATRIGYGAVRRSAQDPPGGHYPVGLRALRDPLSQGPPKLDFLWAGLCILGAVYFIFRSRWSTG